ncbi:MAG: hypothetical protein ABI721_04005 [Candidatus Dojkabacteria bacterium]
MFFDNQTGCGLLGCTQFLNSPFWNFTSIGGLLRIGMASIFAIIIIYGIVIVVKAVLKIVRSEGDPTKIQEGYSMVKGVFIGIVLIFVGLIGLVVVIAFFGAGGIINTTPIVPPGVTIPL